MNDTNFFFQWIQMPIAKSQRERERERVKGKAKQSDWIQQKRE